MNMGQEWPDPPRRPGSFNHPHQRRQSRHRDNSGCLSMVVAVPALLVVALVGMARGGSRPGGGRPPGRRGGGGSGPTKGGGGGTTHYRGGGVKNGSGCAVAAFVMLAVPLAGLAALAHAVWPS